MRKKILLIILVVALVIALLINTVSAESFIATITPSKTTVAESTEFTVTIKVSNIDAGSNGINSISGMFSYDNKVFENVTSSNISGLNGWVPTYFPDSGKIVLIKPSFTKSDEEVVQITLKTKASTSGKSGVVSFKNVEASNSISNIQASDISTTITVGNVSQTPESTPGNVNTNTNNASPININRNSTNNTNTTPIANNTTKNITGTNIIQTNNVVTPSTVNTNINTSNNTVGSQTTESDIPYTGASDNIMKAIFVVLVIAGVSYFKYESIKE